MSVGSFAHSAVIIAVSTQAFLEILFLILGSVGPESLSIDCNLSINKAIVAYTALDIVQKSIVFRHFREARKAHPDSPWESVFTSHDDNSWCVYWLFWMSYFLQVLFTLILYAIQWNRSQPATPVLYANLIMNGVFFLAIIAVLTLTLVLHLLMFIILFLLPEVVTVVEYCVVKCAACVNRNNNNHPIRADDSDQAILQYSTLQKLRTLNPTDNCSICLTPYDQASFVKVLPCGHFFHEPCINTWLNVNAKCPNRCVWFETPWSKKKSKSSV